MKSIILVTAGLLGAASAYGQTIKPGVNAPIAVSATIVTEGAPVVQQLPNGGNKKTYAVTSVRFTNREILEAMRAANLLDGSVSGWVLTRFTNANDVGNLYAAKQGKAAVAVPAALLTQPVVQGKADSGTTTKDTANSPELPALTRRAYTTLTVKAGPGSGIGTQTLKSAVLKIGTSSNTVITRTESFDLSGKGGTGNSIYTGTYKVQRANPINLTPYFPGVAVP
ncbi:hypothetical protein [Luteolibacter sp. LG18]|uniref:hypothetical protein n=1 Tax=Luteolibacter sp. LG18 TaxID=2819286 RepID=UPI002B2B4641|nr:hypothetical protein llg_38130 [Luteolibacter sp. LG18]